jgi:GDP-L-fucose synthase
MRVLVTGAAGFLGSHVVDVLRARGHDVATPANTRETLRSVESVKAMLRDATSSAAASGRLQVVVHVAGLSGGLGMCKAYGERMYHENLGGVNLVRAMLAMRDADRPSLICVGHMCMYGLAAPQPYREVDVLAGERDPVTRWYGEAKRETYRAMLAARERGLRAVCIIPTNLYGPRDAFGDPLKSHAAGAMIERYVDAVRSGAASVTNWGTGSAVRDFLFVQDAAEAIAIASERVDELDAAGHKAINLSGPAEVSIRELAQACADATGFAGQTLWDASKPDGVPRRVLDSALAERVLGWRAQVSISQGVARTAAWLLARMG